MIGSLFSGYGGLDMAAESLGFGPVAWHCEIESAPAKVLAHHYPDVPNLGDITAVDWSSVTPVDVLVGGFPCQDISAAGKRAGIEGARSGLWSCYANAIRVLRPKLVLVENVSGLRSRGLDRVLGDLAEVGYDARWCSVRASDAGAPHRRERFFIVASSAALVAPDTNGAGPQGTQPAERHDLSTRCVPADSDSVGSVRSRGTWDRWAGPADDDSSAADASGVGGERWGVVRDMGSPTSAHQGAGQERQWVRYATDDRSADAARWGKFTGAISRWERVTNRVAPAAAEPTGRDGAQRLSPRFVEWMMGLPAGWVTDVPGLSRTHQLKMLGNGVVPQQAALALRTLLS